VNNPQTDDPQLISRLRQGDPDAWARLCERYGGPLYRFAFHLANGDESLAEDVRQETLLASAEAIHTYRQEAPLFGWLCAIARRKTADEFRRRGRFQGLPEDDDRDPAARWTSLGQESVPEDWIIHRQRRASVVEALWTLPGEYRDALIARYAEGAAVEDIAKNLGRTYKAAESILARARCALRDRLIEVDHG
jgi:RNA polymerase sigma-70 factor (ECF subfamily)